MHSITYRGAYFFCKRMCAIQSQAELFENAGDKLACKTAFLNSSIWRISDNEGTLAFPSLGSEWLLPNLSTVF